MAQQQSPILLAMKQICEEKNIPMQSVIETVEAALAVAYRKDFGEKDQNIKVRFDPETGESEVYDLKTVVPDEKKATWEAWKAEEEAKRAAEEAAKEALKAGGQTPPTEVPKTETPKAEPVVAEPKPEEPKLEAPKVEPNVPEPVPKTAATAETPPPVATAEEPPVERFDPKSEITTSDARKTQPNAQLGDEIRTRFYPPAAYGRMAAQTAKQVIIQRLREAERDTIYKEYKEKEGTILNGTIQRVEGRMVFVDLGHATALLPPPDQIAGEQYLSGQRVKVFLASVNATSKGPELVVSRAHPEMVRLLFRLEVPEIASGAVEIKAMAREAGFRTKVAVTSHERNVDPVGSCVGQRGTRVQTVISELGGEKIDIIEWSDDLAKFIANALSPAKVISVKLNEQAKLATAEVREDQLSLAIGKMGQNVRLASKLSGWRIDVVGEEELVKQTVATGEPPTAGTVAPAVETKPQAKNPPPAPEAASEPNSTPEEQPAAEAKAAPPEQPKAES